MSITITIQSRTVEADIQVESNEELVEHQHRIQRRGRGRTAGKTPGEPPRPTGFSTRSPSPPSWNSYAQAQEKGTA